MGENEDTLSEIFAEALLQPTTEARERYLADACGSDADLRRQVDSLIEAHYEAGSFLEDSIVSPRSIATSARGMEGPGSQIGRYRLLQQIGEGGFGAVFMAEQREPVRRMVALKIIKAGMDTKEVIARFEAERQALALMNHPNIARVLDGGTTESGRPYFVMDLVKGIGIVEFCDRNHLTTEQRLKLFVKVCAGVEHAHQKGVIHRDIKPSNVLVTIEDGEPVPKVIDFGIAKAIGQKLTERTLFTRFEQLIGTPAYMSPEQAEWSGTTVDTRSDIYSLGVLLYELLTGTTPFDRDTVARAALDELRRLIREVDPPRPSTRLLGLGRQINEIAQRRRTEPPALERLVRGDLDWIAMKALEKSPERRYSTASDLAQDVARHLGGEPVSARPPSKAYRAGRFLARHRVGVIAVTAVLLALIVGLILALTGFGQARVEGQKAQEKARQMENLAGENLALAKKSQQASEESERRLIELQVANGIRSVQENGYDDPLLWYGQALAHAHDPAEEEVNRIRVDAIVRKLPKPVRIFTHGERVTCCEFSPDGEYMATSSIDGTARVWDVRTGRAVTPPLKHDNAVRMVSFSADGKRVLTASSDSTAKIWDSINGRLIISLQQHTNAVYSAVFSPNGDRVVTASADGTARLWDSANGELIGVPMRHAKAVLFAIFNADGTRVATASEDQTARVWDGYSGASLTGPLRHDGVVRQVAFSSDGLRLATCANKQAMLWDAKSGLALTAPLRHSKEFCSVAFRPDGAQFATSMADGGKICLWNGFTAECLGPPADGTFNETFHVAYSPDGMRVAAGGSFGWVCVWNTLTGEQTTLPLRHRGYVVWCAFSPDGRFIATASDDHTAKIWDLATAQPEEMVLRHPSRVVTASFSPNGREILTGCADGVARVWDADTGKLLKSFVHGKHMGLARFSPDQHKVLTTSGQHGFEFGGEAEEDTEDYAIEARIWDSETGKLLGKPLRHAKAIEHAAFSADNTRVVTASDDHTARIWDVQTGESMTPPLEHNGIVMHADFSPDGRRVVTACRDGSAQIWDAITGRKICLPMSNLWEIHLALYSPDGGKIFTVNGRAQTGRIWDAETGFPLSPAFKHQGNVYLGAWSPDGSRVIISGLNSGVSVWDSKSGRPVMALSAPELPYARFVNNSIAYSPNGRYIMNGGGTLYSAADGRLLATHPESEFEITEVAFSPDSTRVVASRHDGSVRVWPITRTTMDAQDVVSLAEIVSESKFDRSGNVVSMEPDQLVEEWQFLRGKYPALFDPTIKQVCAWYKERLLEAQAAQYLAGARFFAAQILKLTPDDKDLAELCSSILKLAWQPRSQPVGPGMIDLSEHFTTQLPPIWPVDLESEDLCRLAAATPKLGGDASAIRGLVAVSDAQQIYLGARLPRRVSQIKVGRKCSHLEFLHAAAKFSRKWECADGTKIGSYVVHYANGLQLEIPIIYGDDLRDWHLIGKAPKEAGKSKIAWEAPARSNREVPLRLFKRTWENPLPDIQIESIDMVSAPAELQPFLAAISAE